MRRAKDMNGNEVKGYHCKVSDKHYIILEDAIFAAGQSAKYSAIYGCVEIDPATLGPACDAKE